MARKTKCVKFRVEFVLELDDEFDSIPVHLPEDGINRFISAGATEIGVKDAAIHGGAKFAMSMHWPKAAPPTKATKKKRKKL